MIYETAEGAREFLMRTIAGLEVALMEPERARGIVEELHDDAIKAEATLADALHEPPTLALALRACEQWLERESSKLVIDESDQAAVTLAREALRSVLRAAATADSASHKQGEHE